MFNEKQLKKAIEFYENNNYVILNISDRDYFSKIQSIYNEISSSDFKLLKSAKSFLNEEGIAKHLVNLTRKNKLCKDLFSNYVEDFLEDFLPADKKYYSYYTHTKLSFKTPFKKTNFLPHQDIGYKPENEKREGFTCFIALEDMNEQNGTIEVYEGSHKNGRINHSKITENIHTGDVQLFVEDLSMFKKKSVEMNQGDILIFSQNMVHSSGSSNTNSHRLAIICEIESKMTPSLDDYGKTPIFYKNKRVPFSVLTKLYLKMFFSPRFYWWILKKAPFLSNIILRPLSLLNTLLNIRK